MPEERKILWPRPQPARLERRGALLCSCCAAASLGLALALLSSPAHALGVLISPGNDAYIEATRTLLAKVRSDRTLQLTEISFQAGANKRFLWLLPVAAAEVEDLEVSSCDGSHFEELDLVSRPRVLLRPREEGGCANESIPSPVEASLGASAYTYSPVAIDPQKSDPFTSVEGIQQWMAEWASAGDYTMSGTAPAWAVLSHYVGSSYPYSFVGVEVTASVSTGRACLQIEFTPYTDRDFDHVLPFKMDSSRTEESAVEILVYALDDGLVVPLKDPDTGEAYYDETLINPHEIRATGTETTNYDELFTARMTQASEPPAFVVESAIQLEEVLNWTGSPSTFLTRLRTKTVPTQMNGPDLLLEVTDPEPVPRDYSIVVADGGARPDAALAIAAVALVGCLVARQRRR